MSSLKSQANAQAAAGVKGDAASVDLGKYRLGALLGKGAFGQVKCFFFFRSGNSKTVFFFVIARSAIPHFNRAGVQGPEHRKW
jgi:hypothetical protein